MSDTEYRCDETIDIEEAIMGLEKSDASEVAENITRHTVGFMIEEGAYTVPALSKMSGVSASTLYKWKNGDAIPRKSSNDKVERVMAIVGKRKQLSAIRCGGMRHRSRSSS